MANSADPDQMPQNAASDQGLHCLLTTSAVSALILLSHKNKCYGYPLELPHCFSAEISSAGSNKLISITGAMDGSNVLP